MISHSVSNGAFSRLNRRERLRAQSNQRHPANPPKRQKKQEKKVLVSVLVDVRESEGESWSFSEDIVLLRAIIEIDNSASETDVREEEVGNLRDKPFELSPSS